MSATPPQSLQMSAISRRRFIGRSPPFFITLALAACSRPASRSAADLSTSDRTAQAQRLPSTPACGDHYHTPSQTPGPFYKPNSPLRQSLLEPNTQGTRLTLTGQVLTTDCVPIANSLVDVWQTDNQGRYDNTGNTLRGHQFTDEQGRYRIETIVPGIYPGRTRHLHIKVQAPDRTLLTTQLYLPEEALNKDDFLFQPALLMSVQDTAEGKQAQFDFVV